MTEERRKLIILIPVAGTSGMSETIYVLRENLGRIIIKIFNWR